MGTDIRILKTRQAIESAFISLVEVKGYKNVKLIDIAKKARINRNTIYLHYESKEDIINSIIAHSVSTEEEPFDIGKYMRSRFNRLRIEELFKIIFKTLSTNIELYRILLLEDELVGFFSVELKKIKKTILTHIKQTQKNDTIVSYLVYGIFGVLNDYIVYAKGTVEDNVKTLADLTMSALRRLQY